MADPAYAAHRMRYYCETLNIGYSQPHRNNIYDGGEADCSPLVLRCCKDAGIPTGNAYSTRDMRREMIKAGWQVYNGFPATKVSDLLPDDVLRWSVSASSSVERTDGHGLIPVNGQWTTRTAQRFHRIMHAWGYRSCLPWST